MITWPPPSKNEWFFAGSHRPFYKIWSKIQVENLLFSAVRRIAENWCLHDSSSTWPLSWFSSGRHRGSHVCVQLILVWHCSKHIQNFLFFRYKPVAISFDHRQYPFIGQFIGGRESSPKVAHKQVRVHCHSYGRRGKSFNLTPSRLLRRAWSSTREGPGFPTGLFPGGQQAHLNSN